MRNNIKYIVLFLLIIICTVTNIVFATKKNNSNNYYNETNKPILYGTSKITIPKNYVSTFDILDSRFRVFAKDFEDGDISNNIKSTNNVNPTTPGTYEINYEITDSDNNKTTLNVPVTILDDESSNINIERIVYTIPSVWNMDLAGFARSNYADRQILGIYLNENDSIKTRVLNGDNITIQYFANDSEVEGSNTTITKDWTTIKNGKDHSSIPLINSNVLSKDNNDLNKTYTIELEYSNSINKLDYYHYKDNQDTFFYNWTTNDYSIIDSERLLVVVPLHDNDYMFNYYKNGFSSLDKFLEYYNTVINKYDEYIGLSINPTKITDQNVRTKYLVKANAHGAGAAYYSQNHVAVNSPNVRSFFERNWGGLHELAHGYQGSFGGNNDLSLGEVSNNILGHYVQIDKTIYEDNADWLGKLKDIEDNENKDRLNGTSYLELSQKTRLYFLINLLDYFEGPTTYAKLFSWYREQLNLGRSMKNQDAYVEGIADIYKVNIIPYMESWGVTISESVKDDINSKNLKQYGILKDIVKDNKTLSKIMSDNNIELKYTLIDNDLLKNYKTSITINIDIDNIDYLLNKKLTIKDGNNTIITKTIDSNKITIENIPIGIYSLVMPFIDNYSNDYMSLMITDNNKYTYKYTKLQDIDYNNYLLIKLKGIYDTDGYTLTFKDNYKKASIKLGGADMGTRNDAYVKIYDKNNNIISEEKQVDKYFDYKKAEYEINIDEGYIIEVYHPNNNKVKVISTLTNEVVNELLPTSSTTRYIVIENGIKLESMSDEDIEDINYNNLKQSLINIIENYKKKVTDEELNNKTINQKEKTNVISAYNNLKDNDKEPYTNLINRIKKGGSPIIEEKTNIKKVYKQNESINLYSLITAYDNEDGNITNKLQVVTNNVNNKVPGKYRYK